MKAVVHCSASPQGRGDDAATIHRWHRGRGWDGIGYHHVILEDGTRQPGRPEYWDGAHVAGHNHGSIGICLIGDDAFTPAQESELVALLRELQCRHEGLQIYGHYQLDNRKTCPNIDMPAWLVAHGFTVSNQQ